MGTEYNSVLFAAELGGWMHGWMDEWIWMDDYTLNELVRSEQI